MYGGGREGGSPRGKSTRGELQRDRTKTKLAEKSRADAEKSCSVIALDRPVASVPAPSTEYDDGDLQRTLTELTNCPTPDARLAKLCIRFLAALEDKRSLAQQLREADAQRDRLNAVKGRLEGLCDVLQGQVRELRRQTVGGEGSKGGNDDAEVLKKIGGEKKSGKEINGAWDKSVEKMPLLGIRRKYLDFMGFEARGVKAVDKEAQVGDCKKDDTEDNASKKSEAPITDEVTLDVDSVADASREDGDLKRRASLTGSEVKSDAQCVEAKTSERRPVRGLEVEKVVQVSVVPEADREHLRKGRRDARLSFVHVTRSDIPPR